MDFSGSSRSHHQRSSSSSASDRFLTVFSPPSHQPSILSSNGNTNTSDFAVELNEHDVFWTGDFAQNKITTTRPISSFSKLSPLSRSSFMKSEDRSGILAALSEETTRVPAIRRKASFSPTTAKNSVLAIPKPPSEKDLAMKAADKAVEQPKFRNSAPVNVPVLTREMMKENARRNKKAFFDVDGGEEDGDGEEEEMLPPHEIVARGSALTPNTTFSMLEGVGRTLKGRDLRRVRNAVFRQTGFLD